MSDRLESFLPNLGRGKLLRERVHEVLRDNILNNSMPPGFRLIEEELAESLSVSRTPVREAIQRLEIEGLVTASSGRGFEVAPIVGQDIEDALELRFLLEGYAAEKAAVLATDDQVDRLKQLCSEEQAVIQKDVSRAIGQAQEINRKIHNLVMECAGNGMLGAVSKFVQGQPSSQLFALGDAKNLRLFADSHCRLVQAIAARDQQAAREEVTYHLNLSREILVRDKQGLGLEL